VRSPVAVAKSPTASIRRARFFLSPNFERQRYRTMPVAWIHGQLMSPRLALMNCAESPRYVLDEASG